MTEPLREATLLLGASVLLVLHAPCQQQRTPSTVARPYSIGGTIVDHASGQPLSKAAVMIIRVPAGDWSAVTLTDSEGRFWFNGLDAGKYNLSAEARAHDHRAFHQSDQYSTGIAVGPGLDSEHILFPLAASGSISGRVVDEQGDPVPRAQIWLFCKTVSSGASQITWRGATQTDSSGDFRFAHLSAGTYVVGVQARPWYADNSLAPVAVGEESADPKPLHPELDVAYAVTFYSDTSDPAAAAPVMIKEGSSARIQMTLRAVPAAHVQVTGIGPSADHGVSVRTYAIGPGGYPILQSSGGNSANGQIVIGGLAPGHYVLHLDAWQASAARQMGLGMKTMDVTGTTAIDANTLSRPSLTGQIAFEGEARPDGQARLVFYRAGLAPGAVALIGRDGTFSVNSNLLSLGRHGIALENAPGFYFKSIRVKGATFRRGELDTSDGNAVQLSLVAAKGLTRIDGVVLAAKDGRAVAGAMVLLLPEDPERTDLIRRDQSDSDGTFTLNDVAPGRFTLLAIDDGEGLEYQDPAVIRRYLAGGQVLNLPLKTDSKATVKVQRREREGDEF
ncbi:MAG: carboxypeptidase regulatory-like domain-containing protein [Acidobacteriaceae bacterium]|nr:carboxypeptidase regulatory-like domain-containing protein [Acidobacteriaceae bacterium]